MNNPITIEATIKAPIEKVWQYWTKPEHVTKWNHASEDWHSPKASNDLTVGGSFSYRMEAKDGSIGFDFGGTYSDIKEHQVIAFTMGDDRKVRVEFSSQNEQTHVVELFEPEQTNPIEMQKAGWQAILNNFKQYVELSN